MKSVKYIIKLFGDGLRDYLAGLAAPARLISRMIFIRPDAAYYVKQLLLLNSYEIAPSTHSTVKYIKVHFLRASRVRARPIYHDVLYNY